eukprot:COSAG04_NODE_12542_length_647_cov_1.795620_1_plen_49_part_01
MPGNRPVAARRRAPRVGESALSRSFVVELAGGRYRSAPEARKDARAQRP